MTGSFCNLRSCLIKKLAFSTFALALSFPIAQSNLAFIKSQGKKQPSRQMQAQKSEPTPQVREAIDKLKADFESELALRQANMKSLSEDLQKKQELYAQGIISRKEVKEAETNFKAAQAEMEARRQKISKEIEQANDFVAEVMAAELLAKTPLRGKEYISTNALIRYGGGANWIISDIRKVSSYFVSTFHQPLPISAFGQTEVHSRLGFDHSNSVDVALHPDSAEGQALIVYLRNAGIPFLAFRQAVPGSATGAHIHIGYPSHRFIRR